MPSSDAIATNGLRAGIKSSGIVPGKIGQIAAIATMRHITLTNDRNRLPFAEVNVFSKVFDSVCGLNRDRPPAA